MQETVATKTFLCRPWSLENCFALLLFSILSFISARAVESPQSLLVAGRVDQAIQILEPELHESPTPETYNLLCRAHLELTEWDRGIPFCEKAVALAPRNGVYHLWLGRIYGEKADHAGFLSAAGLARKVRTEFERAVELAPGSWEARTDLAEFYLEAPGIVGGGKDKALAQAEQLEALNPGVAHWVRARLAEKNKYDAEAEREYRAAIKGKPRRRTRLAESCRLLSPHRSLRCHGRGSAHYGVEPTRSSRSPG